MHSMWMQQQANEKISNARIQAKLEREVNRANSATRGSNTILRTLLSTLRGWLVKIAAIRPVKKEEAVTLIES